MKKWKSTEGKSFSRFIVVVVDFFFFLRSSYEWVLFYCKIIIIIFTYFLLVVIKMIFCIIKRNKVILFLHCYRDRDCLGVLDFFLFWVRIVWPEDTNNKNRTPSISDSFSYIINQTLANNKWFTFFWSVFFVLCWKKK
jgi:hypothetical protein